jgi:DNA-binding PucR family transcriptional regulator
VDVVTPSPEIVELIGEVAERMLENLDQLVEEMDAVEIAPYPEVSEDPGLVADTTAANRANLTRLLTMWARREVGGPHDDIPPEAMDVARAVARRGFDFDMLFQSYRLGQNVAWRSFMGHAVDIVPPGPTLVELLQVASQGMFEYVDNVVTRVIAAAQREREEVIGGALARKAEAVRLILDGAPMDIGRASARLDYVLARRHTALVVWCEPPSEGQGDLESTANALARAARARLPLLLSVGPSTLWAWLGTEGEPALEDLREAMRQASTAVSVAVGPTRSGIAGFRASHAAARTLQSLLVARRAGPQLAMYYDLEVAALVSQDHERAAEFVAHTLGPLAAYSPAAERLRETLRVFLDEAEHAPRTAARLHLHRNTVLQRVARATELLGRPPGERRLATELALELAHQIGPRVLTDDEPGR